MKKVSFVLILCVFFCGQVKAQEQRIEEYVTGLTFLNGLFEKWLASMEKIADPQTKQKFVTVCKEVFFDVNDLRNQKELMLVAIKEGGKGLNEIEAFRSRVKVLRATLEKSDQLSKSITGVSSIEAINSLKKDLSEKELYLLNVSNKENYEKNLEKGIAVLKSSEKTLKELIEALEK